MIHPHFSRIFKRISSLANKSLVFVSLVVIGSFALGACSQPLGTSSQTQVTQGFTANVMAPLHVTDWQAFEAQLATAKDIGVDAVSVDVWWGDVERAGDNQFDWSYYHKIFSKIREADLRLVAIMSFHQAGGNVGDDYTALLPEWIWTHYEDAGIHPDDLKYRSETGAYSSEYISLWALDIVSHQYVEFMQAFEQEFADYSAYFDEINISAGTAGELRYPSYNPHDWGGYPNRGTLQGYGRLAIEDFKRVIRDKYQSVDAVNQAWTSAYSRLEDISLPSDVDSFFNSGDFQATQYGRDVLDWYHNALLSHGRAKIQLSIDSFDSHLKHVPIGIKIPGIHWSIGHPQVPRAAEFTAGLIPGDLMAESTLADSYESIVSVAHGWQRDVNFHFTCLEMNNENQAPAFSRAKDLVTAVAAQAQRQGVVIKGENALSYGAGSVEGWSNMDNAVKSMHYSGLTILRMNQVTENPLGRDAYQQLISDMSK